MATQREVPKKQGGLFLKSPVSLNAGTGWAAAAPTSEAGGANSTTEPTGGNEPAARYLTTSGIFERPPRPPAWKVEDILAASPEPARQPSELVTQFRSALAQSQNETVEPRKSRKGIFALAVLGILLAATAAAIYLNHPKRSAVEFQTAKTWVATGWTAGLQEISRVFHSQKVSRNANESNRRGLSTFLRGRQSASLGLPTVPASLWETRPDENTAHFNLYVTDTFGRRWVLTPTGQEFGPTDHLGADLR